MGSQYAIPLSYQSTAISSATPLPLVANQPVSRTMQVPNELSTIEPLG